MLSKKKGDLSVVKLMQALIAGGYAVLIPFGDCDRYDLVADDGEKFIRIQCKTGWITETNAVTCFACDSDRRTYDGQVDAIGIYCPEIDKVYLIPIEELGGQQTISLRLGPPKNGQVKKTRFAKEFEIASVTQLVE